MTQRCAACVIGVMKPLVKEMPVSPAPDQLVMVRERGFRCSTCGAESGFRIIAHGNLGATAAVFGAKCDFCGTKDPITQFPCQDFTVTWGGKPEVCYGAWAACAACRDLVLAEDCEGLISRAIFTITTDNPKLTRARLARGEIPGRRARLYHEGFWKHRITD